MIMIGTLPRGLLVTYVLLSVATIIAEEDTARETKTFKIVVLAWNRFNTKMTKQLTVHNLPPRSAPSANAPVLNLKVEVEEVGGPSVLLLLLVLIVRVLVLVLVLLLVVVLLLRKSNTLAHTHYIGVRLR